MKSLVWHPEDVRWLRGWLRSHFVCVLAIAAFLLMLRLQPHRSPPLEARASQTRQWELSKVGPGLAESTEAAPPWEMEPLPFSPGQSRPVAPTGWRRTDYGWENVSTWRSVARPLGEIVMRQEAREPDWMKFAMAKLRQIPPLAFAMLQIAAIAAIVGISRRDASRTEIDGDATFSGPFAGHRRSASR